MSDDPLKREYMCASNGITLLHSAMYVNGFDFVLISGGALAIGDLTVPENAKVRK